jgi:hypothetical protein
MRKYIIYSLFVLFTILALPVISGNPIPVYPKPEPSYYSASDYTNLNFTWIIGALIIDFFMNLLIIYGGVIVLNHYNLIINKNIFDISKKTLLLSVLIISITGFISELILGPWLGGFLLSLIIIFTSFVLVAKYLLKINWINSIRMGLIALIVNIIFWIIIFSL